MTASRIGAAVDDHQRSLESYIAVVQGLDDARWVRERAPGEWSPALITQHLILYYEAFAKVAAGELKLRYRVGPFWRTLLRWFLVPHVLFHRKLPLKAVAPREVRPAGEVLPRSEAIVRLREAVELAEEAIRATAGRKRVRLSHPYFGEMSPLRFLRFSAVHLDHHRRQVESTPEQD